MSDPDAVTSDAVTSDAGPAAPAPAAQEPRGPVMPRIRSLAGEARRWIRTDARRALLYAGIGLLISWAGNLVIIGAVYNGYAKAPAGAEVTTPSSFVTGAVVWTLGMGILFGLITYAQAVGSNRFWADVRGFPESLMALARSDARTYLPQLLWAFAGAMLVAVILTGATAALLGLTTLILLTSVLRPILVGALGTIWRRVVGALVPNHAKPPADQVLVVAVLGVVVALVGALLVPGPLRLVLGIGAGVAAFMIGQRGAPSPGVAAIVVGVAAGLALAFIAQPVLGHDGGWQECGAAWLQCGGSGLLGWGLVGGAFGAGGALAGSGLGDALANQRIREGWGASFESGFTNQIRFLGTRDMVDPIAMLGGLFGAPGDMPTPGSEAIRDWAGSGGLEGALREFASDPLDFAEKHHITDFIRDFPGQEHGPTDEIERYRSMVDEFQRAQAAGDNAKTNMLGGMLVAELAWLASQVVDPGAGLEATAGKLGARTAAREAEGAVARELTAAERAALYGHVPTDVALTAEQRAFLERKIASVDPLRPTGKDTLNKTFILSFDDGGRALFKPESGGGERVTDALTGPRWASESGTQLWDRGLGFNQVPTTAPMDHPELGRGSVQAWSDARPYDPAKDSFSTLDEQKCAVRDYITGETDRHYGQVLVGSDNSMVPVDHGESFPVAGDDPLMRSEYVHKYMDQDLAPEIMQNLQSVDRDAMRQTLLDGGLSQQQVDRSLARFDSVLSQGRITGAGLGDPGQTVTILNGNFQVKQVTVP